MRVLTLAFAAGLGRPTLPIAGVTFALFGPEAGDRPLWAPLAFVIGEPCCWSCAACCCGDGAAMPLFEG
jgi:hypothetical protein